MKSIANYISIARIILVLLLIGTKPFSVGFYLVYIMSGLSDMMDGYIARKTKSESKLGEKLDSVADLIMLIVVMIKIYPLINLSLIVVYWIIGIALIRITSMVVLLIKYKKFGILHSIGNKITGLLLFSYPLIMKSDILIHIILIIATISAAEELVIHFISKEFLANRKSIIDKHNKL
jgi:CDP-diacylglycerol--glycerol-3-phosphate 3-phosphatidyltransferase